MLSRSPARCNAAATLSRDRVVGVLENVELVINDAASRNPLRHTEPERFPHVHAGRLNAFALTAAQLRSEELVQRFLLPLLAKPQWLAGLQIAHYGKKLVDLPPINLIYAHLPERRRTSRCHPSLQTAQVDRPHRALCQTTPPRHFSRRSTFTCLSDCILEPLAERRLTRQRRH